MLTKIFFTETRNKHERLIPQRKVERHRVTMRMKGCEGVWVVSVLRAEESLCKVVE